MKKVNLSDIFVGPNATPTDQNYKDLYIYRQSGLGEKPYAISNIKTNPTQKEKYNIYETYLYDISYSPNLIPEFMTHGVIKSVTTNTGLILIYYYHNSSYFGMVLYDLLESDTKKYGDIIATSEFGDIAPTTTIYKSTTDYDPLACSKKIYFQDPISKIAFYKLNIVQIIDNKTIFASDFDLNGVNNSLFDSSFNVLNLTPLKWEGENFNTHLYYIDGVFTDLWSNKIILPYKQFFLIERFSDVTPYEINIINTSTGEELFNKTTDSERLLTPLFPSSPINNVTIIIKLLESINKIALAIT